MTDQDVWVCPQCDDMSKGWVCPNCGWCQKSGTKKCQECTFVNKGLDKDCSLCGATLQEG